MKPTPEEIKAEIAKLREMKPTVLRKSAFGDNHHDAIDAQIEVLEEDLILDTIYERFDDEKSNVLDSAVEANDWREGDIHESPSSNWQSLVR